MRLPSTVDGRLHDLKTPLVGQVGFQVEVVGQEDIPGQSHVVGGDQAGTQGQNPVRQSPAEIGQASVRGREPGLQEGIEELGGVLQVGNRTTVLPAVLSGERAPGVAQGLDDVARLHDGEDPVGDRQGAGRQIGKGERRPERPVVSLPDQGRAAQIGQCDHSLGMEAALVGPEPVPGPAIEFLHEPGLDLPEEPALRVDAEVLVVHEEMGQQVELIGHVGLGSVAFDGAFGVLVIDVAAIGDGRVGGLDEIPDEGSGAPGDGSIQILPGRPSRHRRRRGLALRGECAGALDRGCGKVCQRQQQQNQCRHRTRKYGFGKDLHIAEFPRAV